MSEKEAVDFARAHSSLRQANHGTAATIKQQPLAGDFDENGRAKSLSIRDGSSRTEHRDAHRIRALGCRNVAERAYPKD